MRVRAFFAIVLCKLLRVLSRALHRGGTAMPGRWAQRVCPGLLGILAIGYLTYHAPDWIVFADLG